MLALILLFAVISPLMAAEIPIDVDAGWYATEDVPPSFHWDETGYVDGPFTFTSTTAVTVKVTDDFLTGDQFRIFDNSILIGETPIVTKDSGGEIGPDAAFDDPLYSSGSFLLESGAHSISILPIGDSYTSGRGYIRVDTVIIGIIEIDIKPDSDNNSINLKSKGVIPVAILGNDSFDVNSIDVSTLVFGPGGASPDHKQQGHFEDVNEDGFLDLVVHIRTQETGITESDTESSLTGETIDSLSIEDSDIVKIVGDKSSNSNSNSKSKSNSKSNSTKGKKGK
jgi:hypothetical protein